MGGVNMEFRQIEGVHVIRVRSGECELNVIPVYLGQSDWDKSFERIRSMVVDGLLGIWY